MVETSVSLLSNREHLDILDHTVTQCVVKSKLTETRKMEYILIIHVKIRNSVWLTGNNKPFGKTDTHIGQIYHKSLVFLNDGLQWNYTNNDLFGKVLRG
jgi:hypothetical protein